MSPLLLLAWGSSVDFATLLQVGQAITTADRNLQAKGWRPAPERQPDQLDRERAGNPLASLSACSGSGLGYCRYDYRRGQHTLTVITAAFLPGAGPGASVVRWSDGPAGRLWGLCQQEASARLLPCGGQ
ncbi:hypothetical protein KBY66_01950 [Synechococcus sp. Tobar12-5m-g]|uniref:hypothetical protein n=1 Tax=unclassified Synechococcus TaxID=2626047 RepID=UPI0020CBE985|nr:MULTISPECIES: hypothetical protein [unclassified Synechococcus]MCP9771401.1 hypothetical protein [Synechococcus sp. Tobar12-5m-g]MCP9872340.1 hypothetical protein [Synechococcus sp. Cruz CV-v-12]